jgi:hypothetical protein
VAQCSLVRNIFIILSLISHTSQLSSLDTIGLAGFSHDFESFSDHRSDISNAFEELANSSMGIMDALITVLRPSFPLVTRIPTQRTRGIWKLKAACAAVAKQFMERMGKLEENGERSVMGLLCKSFTNTWLVFCSLVL